MKKFLIILAMAATLLCGAGPVAMPVYAVAADKGVCKDADATMKEVLGCPSTEPATVGGVANTWITVVLSFVGVAAVVMIIVGGIFYIKSSGDPSKAKRARDIIIYSVVGLIITLLAYAIVALVSENIKGTTGL